MRQSISVIPSIKDRPFYIIQRWDFSSPSPLLISVNIYTTSDLLTANCGTIGITCNRQRNAIGIILGRTCMFDVTRSILTSNSQYHCHEIPLLSVIIFLSYPQKEIQAPQTPQQGASGSQLGRLTGALSNVLAAAIQQQRRLQLAHSDAANVATHNMTLGTCLKVVLDTGSRKNIKQHAIRCE